MSFCQQAVVDSSILATPERLQTPFSVTDTGVIQACTHTNTGITQACTYTDIIQA